MTQPKLRLFNAWVHALPYAGIHGAVHYHWNGERWVDHRYTKAQQALDALGIDYILRQHGEDFSIWVQGND